MEDESNKKRTLSHMGLCCQLCCPPFPSGAFFVKFIRYSMLQFVALKPFLALALALLEIKDHETPHSNHSAVHTIERAMSLVQIVTAICVIIALYALFNLYKVTKPLLVGLNPLAKFLAIKALVAFTILQRLILTLLVYKHVIKGNGHTSADMRSLRLQNFLISIEMVFFTVVFFFVFSYSEFRMKSNSEIVASPAVSYCGKLGHAFRFYDIVSTRVDTMIKNNEMVQLTSPSSVNKSSSSSDKDRDQHHQEQEPASANDSN